MEITVPADRDQLTPQFADLLSLLRNSQLNIKIFKEKSRELLQRLEKTVLLVGSFLDASVSDLRTKHNFVLLRVLIEEAIDYFVIFAEYSKETVAHLARFGGDEELFSKWTERLQFIALELHLPLDTNLIFDKKQDNLNLKTDLAYLRAELKNITSNDALIEIIIKTLTKQQNSAYATLMSPTSSITINPSKIKYLGIIGEGAYGTVWKARMGPSLVAVNKMKLNHLNEMEKAALRQEAEIMRQLSHPRIVACVGAFENEDEYCMVLEFCSAGSVAQVIAGPPITYYQRIDLLLDISMGMEYLHKLHVVHRDLKPGNIVLDEFMRAKIVDFGLAVTKTSTMTSFRGATEAGTPAFMAPECFGIVPIYSTKTDVFAFSIILWELSHWQQSYYGVALGEIRDAIKNGDRLPIRDEIPESDIYLIISCWNQNPKERLSFADITKTLKGISSKKEESDIIIDAEVIGKTVVGIEKNFVFEPNESDSIFYRFKGVRISKRNAALVGFILTIVLLGVAIGIFYAVSARSLSTKSSIVGVTTTVLVPDIILSTASLVKVATPIIMPTTTISTTTMTTTAPSAIQYAVTTLVGNGEYNAVDGQGTKASMLWPFAIAMNGSNIIFSDISNSASIIRKINSTGYVSKVSGGLNGNQNGNGSVALFYRPYGLTSFEGVIYVADLLNFAVRVIDRTGTTVTLSLPLIFPLGITIDSTGNNIFVIDAFGQAIRRFCRDGSSAILFQGFSQSSIALIIDSTDTYLYVTDKVRIWKITIAVPSTVVFAGSLTAGTNDGYSVNATFTSLEGITLDTWGNFYVADQNCIRKINSTG